MDWVSINIEIVIIFSPILLVVFLIGACLMYLLGTFLSNATSKAISKNEILGDSYTEKKENQ
jgi:Mg2+/Co2+ transporter CorB